MTPELLQLQKQVDDLARSLQSLEQLFNQHGHAGVEVDRSPKLSGGSIYCGTVGNGGAAGSVFPAGWSAVKNSLGNYTVTHNLGITNYIVVAQNYADSTGYFIPQNWTATTFDVLTYNTSSSSADRAFAFILVVQ